jgi:hypothetical protein
VGGSFTERFTAVAHQQKSAGIKFLYSIMRNVCLLALVDWLLVQQSQK